MFEFIDWLDCKANQPLRTTNIEVHSASTLSDKLNHTFDWIYCMSL